MSSSEMVCSSSSPGHTGMAALCVRVEGSGQLSHISNAAEACRFSSSTPSSVLASLSRGGTQLADVDASAIHQACIQQGRQVGSGRSAAGCSSYSHVLEHIWGGEANVVSQHGRHVVLPGAKDLDLPDVGVSPVLMVADDCQLHKVCLQVLPADGKWACCVLPVCSCRTCGCHLHVLTESAALHNTAGKIGRACPQVWESFATHCVLAGAHFLPAGLSCTMVHPLGSSSVML